MRGAQCFRRRFVSQHASSDQSHLGRAALQKQFANVLVTKFPGHLVGRGVEAKLPLIDSTARPFVDHGEELVADAEANAARIRIEVPAYEIQVSQGSNHEKVGLA